MIRKNFWDLTNRPYTRLKLRILSEYLPRWADIIFNQGIKNNWLNYKDIYYVDCCAGRGKYHFGGKTDIIDGSPLIALKCAIDKQKKFNYKTRLNCIFVEKDKKFSEELEKFCEKYKNKVNFLLYKETDINEKIYEIINLIGYKPAFFFIDPGGLEISKETIKTIVNKKGARDILFNYIKGGVERITGLINKKDTAGLSEKNQTKRLKTIKNLENFYSTHIYESLNKTEKERLREWVETILKNDELKEIAVFDMPYYHKSDNIYYLLFASRKPVAKTIIKAIFRDAKKITYKGQTTMPFDTFEI